MLAQGIKAEIRAEGAEHDEPPEVSKAKPPFYGNMELIRFKVEGGPDLQEDK